jgi:hypothetical protein
LRFSLSGHPEQFGLGVVEYEEKKTARGITGGGQLYAFPRRVSESVQGFVTAFPGLPLDIVIHFKEL